MKKFTIFNSSFYIYGKIDKDKIEIGSNIANPLGPDYFYNCTLSTYDYRINSNLHVATKMRDFIKLRTNAYACSDIDQSTHEKILNTSSPCFILIDGAFQEKQLEKYYLLNPSRRFDNPIYKLEKNEYEKKIEWNSGTVLPNILVSLLYSVDGFRSKSNSGAFEYKLEYLKDVRRDALKLMTEARIEVEETLLGYYGKFDCVKNIYTSGLHELFSKTDIEYSALFNIKVTIGILEVITELMSGGGKVFEYVESKKKGYSINSKGVELKIFQ